MKKISPLKNSVSTMCVFNDSLTLLMLVSRMIRQHVHGIDMVRLDPSDNTRVAQYYRYTGVPWYLWVQVQYRGMLSPYRIFLI